MAPVDPFSPSEDTLLQARRLLRRWIARRVAKEGLAWLDAECEAAAGREPVRRFYMSFSAACRHAGKEPLDLGKADRAAADRARPGWDPSAWTTEHAARTLLLLHREPRNRTRWLEELTMLLEHADLGEQVALHQALPVLPHPESLVERCAEGVRSNATDVFRAVAHRNPYPSEFLPDPAWNQMVLKALFVEVGLAPVIGLDERANPTLARMLCDFARERWAAHRPVSPELWRCVGPHADAEGVQILERALQEGDAATKEAAAGALRRNPWPEASYALARHGLSPKVE